MEEALDTDEKTLEDGDGGEPDVVRLARLEDLSMSGSVDGANEWYSEGVSKAERSKRSASLRLNSEEGASFQLVDGERILLGGHLVERVPGFKLSVKLEKFLLAQLHKIVRHQIQQVDEFYGDIQVLGRQTHGFQRLRLVVEQIELEVEVDLEKPGQRVQTPVKFESVDFLCLCQLWREANVLDVFVEREHAAQ
ncbi:hypothetical protein OGATHE_005884 [Ogataea polymorpha]|uniref:Uncharacterized protein n=1 Tax=Ogataea polymorpha TaxID=460523 RepID=A0A9P8SZ87_9ASCO|nr:hypothetical protein OGATHE_005884 [Ogataea polymorpha]